MKKRNWIADAAYCVHDGMLYSQWFLFLLIAKIVLEILTPLAGTLTSAVVVYALSNGFDPSQYALAAIILSSVTLLLEIGKVLVTSRYEWISTFARCTTSWLRMTGKELYTDYPNIEIRSRRAALNRGFQALESNWVGIEGSMKEFPNLLIGLIGMILYGVLAAIYVPWILLVLFAMLISGLSLSIWAARYIDKKKKESEVLFQRRNLLSKDATDKENAKDVRSYRLQKWFLSLFDELSRSVFSFEMKINLRLFVGEVSDNVFSFARDLVSYFILIGLAINKAIDVSTFVFLVGIVAGFSTWINSFVSSFNKLRRFSVDVNDYRNALKIKDACQDGGLTTASLAKPISIVFDHVSFSYPDAEKPTLRDVSIEIKAGEKIALVGNNGAGKTTMVKLLSGLYRPTAGRILINGTDAKEFNREEYFGLISAVFQDVRPLAFTVLNNVTCLRKEESDLPRFWRCVDEAGLKAKIESLPKKEDSYITQTFDLSGVRFSGGETQKLMLARSLYKNAPVLLLDEPTAALDPLSEEAMYKEYLSFASGNTSVFISHRLASTRFCDRIVFLSDGTIEEVGTHEELLKKNGLYAETFAIQAKYYKEIPNEIG